MINIDDIIECPHCGAKHLNGPRCPRCGRGPGANEAVRVGKEQQQPSKKARMNSTEQRYADILAWRVHAEEIKAFVFEAVKFRLADRTTFTPDFLVITLDDRVELHEVKGGWVREDAWLKFKIAREMYPYFSWQMHQWKQGEWTQIG